MKKITACKFTATMTQAELEAHKTSTVHDRDCSYRILKMLEEIESGKRPAGGHKWMAMARALRLTIAKTEVTSRS